MTKEEINKKICKDLGIQHHAWTWKREWSCCCGFVTDTQEKLKLHFKDSNTDFTENAAVLLKEIENKLSDKALNSFLMYLCEPYSISGYIEIRYVTNSEALCLKFMEWRKL